MEGRRINSCIRKYLRNNDITEGMVQRLGGIGVSTSVLEWRTDLGVRELEFYS